MLRPATLILVLQLCNREQKAKAKAEVKEQISKNGKESRHSLNVEKSAIGTGNIVTMEFIPWEKNGNKK